MRSARHSETAHRIASRRRCPSFRGLLAVFVVAAFASGSPVLAGDAQAVSFVCDDGTTILVSWLGDEAARLERGGDTVSVTRIVSGSGARYEGDEVLFWTRGETAQVEWRGVELDCRVAQDAARRSAVPSSAVPSLDGPPNEIAAWPVPEGRVAQAVEQLPGLVAEMMPETGVPGVAVAVVHGDEIVYAGGFGERRAGSGEPVDADTVFQLASISKTVGATVVAGAVGDGSVAWTDPIVTHLPDFALADPWVTRHVTLADMYSHRSGLPGHAGDLLEDLGFERAQVLERLRFAPLAPFRAVYAYTNFGLTAAAEAVAAAAGTSWEELSRRRLYDRIGMSRTSSTYADFAARENRAVGHQQIDGEWRFVEQRQPDAQSPAGGVSSSARDMGRWMRLLLADGVFDGERVIDAEALLAIQTPHMRSSSKGSATARTSFYGLGTGVSTDATARVRLTHSGAFLLGAATTFAAVPAADVGIVVLTNAQPVGLAEAISSAFLDVVEFGGVTRDWSSAFQRMFAPILDGPASRLDDVAAPSDPEPALGLDAYVGTYANDFYGPVRIAVDDTGLVLTAGPRDMAFRLEHWDANTFAFQTRGENRSGVSVVDFTVGPDGVASSVWIEKWDDPEGVGELRRVERPGSP
jgi:CubicO group peptidase (beta-lactamase class C family)